MGSQVSLEERDKEKSIGSSKFIKTLATTQCQASASTLLILTGVIGYRQINSSSYVPLKIELLDQVDDLGQHFVLIYNVI